MQTTYGLSDFDYNITHSVAIRANIIIHDRSQWNDPFSNYLSAQHRQHQRDAAIMSIRSGVKISSNPQHHALLQLNQLRQSQGLSV